MAGLLYLPDETVLRIINSVHSVSCLAFLARVSRRFHNLCLLILYTNVAFRGAGAGVGTKHLRSFALLMLQKPELAALVRSFSIRDNWSSWCEEKEAEEVWRWPDHPELDTILESAIIASVRNRKVARQWLDLVRNGRNEATIIALILPMLPNMRSLDVTFDIEAFGDGGSGETYYLPSMWQRASNKELASHGRIVFSSLVNIMLSGRDDK